MKCIVRGCENNFRRKPGRVSFHSFPNDERRELWKKALGVKDVDSRSRVCSKHFKKSDIIRLRLRHTALDFYAVPVLHLDEIPDTVPIQNNTIILGPECCEGAGQQPTFESELISNTDPLKIEGNIDEFSENSEISANIVASPSPSCDEHDQTLHVIHKIEEELRYQEENRPGIPYTICEFQELPEFVGSQQINLPQVNTIEYESFQRLPKMKIDESLNVKKAMEDSDTELSAANHGEEKKLKYKLNILRERVNKKLRKIKSLRQVIRRRDKTLSRLKPLLKEMRRNKRVNEELKKVLTHLTQDISEKDDENCV